MKTKTKDFLDEIIACLLARREEWRISGERLTHESGVSIRAPIRDSGRLEFDPPFALSYSEKERVHKVVDSLRRLHITESLGVTQVENRVPLEQLERTNKMFFSNIMHSIRNDPDSWELSEHTLKHVSGISIWAANDIKNRRFYEPELEVTELEKKSLDDTIEQHKRYVVLKQINEKLPKLEANAKTWGSRCPYCLDRPEGACYRCECDILLHLECAQETDICPVCSEPFEMSEKKCLPVIANSTGSLSWWRKILNFFSDPRSCGQPL